MFAAAHDLEKGRKEVEDHASIFISHQLRYHVEMLTKNVLNDDKITVIPKSAKVSETITLSGILYSVLNLKVEITFAKLFT